MYFKLVHVFQKKSRPFLSEAKHGCKELSVCNALKKSFALAYATTHPN